MRQQAFPCTPQKKIPPVVLYDEGEFISVTWVSNATKMYPQKYSGFCRRC